MDYIWVLFKLSLIIVGLSAICIIIFNILYFIITFIPAFFYAILTTFIKNPLESEQVKNKEIKKKG